MDCSVLGVGITAALFALALYSLIGGAFLFGMGAVHALVTKEILKK